MKKLLLISIVLLTCNPRAIITAQNNHQDPPVKLSALDSAWASLELSKDTLAMIVTDIKKSATQKVVYRTKIIRRVDTVWRIDTCIAILQPIDSLKIAVMFQNRIPAKKTKAGRVIEYIFHSKKIKEQDPED